MPTVAALERQRGTHARHHPPAIARPNPVPGMLRAASPTRRFSVRNGRDGLDARLTEQWRAFAPVAGDWLTVIRGEGPAAVETVYAAALDGKIAPDRGHVLTMANPTPPGLSNRQKGPI
jgi:hypothetical protein